jgi:hypothetical protein
MHLLSNSVRTSCAVCLKCFCLLILIVLVKISLKLNQSNFCTPFYVHNRFRCLLILFCSLFNGGKRKSVLLFENASAAPGIVDRDMVIK